MPFPEDLQDQINLLMTGTASYDLKEASIKISEKYRRLNADNLQIASEAEAKAYLATRFPATFAVADEIFMRLKNIWPDMSPVNILDLGAGPGTATIAAINQWPVLEATLVECNPHLSNLGRRLLNTQCNWQAQNLQTYQPMTNHDLIVASYVFNEINNFESMLDKYWRITSKAFVLIEPGTPQGYEIVVKARDYLLSQGAFIAAPCPHHFTCPLKNSNRWCHFSKRVSRSQLHRQIKSDAVLAYEDEKFSYLIATREKLAHPYFRTLGHSHGEKVLSLETCQKDGSFQVLSSSKRYPDFKRLKKLDWGDAFYG